MVKPWYVFFRRIVQNNLNITDLEDFENKTNNIYNIVKDSDLGGFVPTYNPQLLKANEDGFAVSIWTIDGQRFNFGDFESYVWMHQITSIVSYLIALEQNGKDKVSSYLGTEPSGKPYDSLELKDGIPHNPLISSGILTSWSLIYQDESIDRKYELYSQVIQKLIGGVKVDFNNEMYLSEIKRSDRNYWLLYMLKEEGTLPDNSHVKQIMQLCAQTYAIELKVKDYAVLAASLANGGIWPVTEERVFSDPDAVKGVLSQMLSWGMNTFSGKWAFKWGLPAKTSISGVTVLVIPNHLGIAVWSPKLDKYYNSMKAQDFLSRFVKEFSYDTIDHIYGAGITNKLIMKSMFNFHNTQDSFHLLYFAKFNKLRDIRKSIAKGYNVNYKDYDARTALHLACNYGNLEIVKYLVDHNALINVKDRFGNTLFDVV